MFRWNGTDWIEEAVLIGLDTQVDDGFGLSISIDGNLIAVGSRTDESGTNSGSVYLFRNNGSTWVQETKLTASDATAIDNFGISVATGNSYVVIGTSGGDSDVITNSGSVYVYRFDGMDWIEQVELFASDAGEFDGFGRSVATDGDYIIVGAPYRPCTCADEQFCDDGLAYLFRRNGVNWVEQYRLTATDATSICFFGLAVSLDGDLFVTGALDPGHTYVHFLPPPIPTVSQWGLVSMTLMILISGTILIRFL